MNPSHSQQILFLPLPWRCAANLKPRAFSVSQPHSLSQRESSRLVTGLGGPQREARFFPSFRRMHQAFSVRDREGNAEVLALKEVTRLGGKATTWMLLMAVVCSVLRHDPRHCAPHPPAPNDIISSCNQQAPREIKTCSSIHLRDEKMAG